MQSMTQAQKQRLANAAATGTKIYEIAYDPSTGATPEPAAVSAGLILFYRETSTKLTEAIYTNRAVP